MTPTSAAAAPVAMNSTIFTRSVGTPAPLAAFTLPPAANTQSPKGVLVNTQFPARAIANHKRIETLACPHLEAKARCAEGDSGTETVVVLASSGANPSDAPAKPKLAANVTMKDGRPVRTVSKPLNKPTAAPMRRARPIMTHTGSPPNVAPIATIIAAAPTTDPIDRSN